MFATHDLQEGIRLSNQWLGATARTFWGQPAFALAAHPLPSVLAAWGEVTERSFERVATIPEWGIGHVVSDGRRHAVKTRTAARKPFCDLVRFSVQAGSSARRSILLVAPMSGHYATLTRKTVASLLPDCDVHVTAWRNARDVPLSAGSFDIEDYTNYLVDFTTLLGPDVHVVAVCQPAPLALAATAALAAERPESVPRTLTLIGGPVDPDANPTDITDFGGRFTMGQLEAGMIQTVGLAFAGAGRKVYPGQVQLASFMSMNWKTHAEAFASQISRVARNEDHDGDRHNAFYDEYLAVMDLTAEFYLSTVERIFKRREIARNAFTLGGKPVDISGIAETAVLVVEGGRDDISAPGQCLAALDLLRSLPADMKESHLEPDAGHYGIFAGRHWQERIRPRVLAFIDRHGRA